MLRLAKGSDDGQHPGIDRRDPASGLSSAERPAARKVLRSEVMAMALSGWLQLALFVGLLFVVTKPLGLYLVRVLEPEGKTCLDRPVKPVERLPLSDPRHRPQKGAGLEAIHSVPHRLQPGRGLLFTYAVLRLQHVLPLNPQRFGPVRARPRLQHCCELHHQHELAELRGGIHPVLFFTNGRARFP